MNAPLLLALALAAPADLPFEEVGTHPEAALQPTAVGA